MENVTGGFGPQGGSTDYTTSSQKLFSNDGQNCKEKSTRMVPIFTN